MAGRENEAVAADLDRARALEHLDRGPHRRLDLDDLGRRRVRRVEVLDGDAGPMTEAEASRLESVSERTDQTRLSCQVQVRDDLTVKTVMIDDGSTLRRGYAAARGRYKPTLHRSSHITVVLSDQA